MAGRKPETAKEQPSAMSASPRQQPLQSGVNVGAWDCRFGRGCPDLPGMPPRSVEAAAWGKAFGGSAEQAGWKSRCLGPQTAPVAQRRVAGRLESVQGRRY